MIRIIIICILAAIYVIGTIYANDVNHANANNTTTHETTGTIGSTPRSIPRFVPKLANEIYLILLSLAVYYLSEPTSVSRCNIFDEFISHKMLSPVLFWVVLEFFRKINETPYSSISRVPNELYVTVSKKIYRFVTDSDTGDLIPNPQAAHTKCTIHYLISDHLESFPLSPSGELCGIARQVEPVLPIGLMFQFQNKYDPAKTMPISEFETILRDGGKNQIVDLSVSTTMLGLNGSTVEGGYPTADNDGNAIAKEDLIHIVNSLSDRWLVIDRTCNRIQVGDQPFFPPADSLSTFGILIRNLWLYAISLVRPWYERLFLTYDVKQIQLINTFVRPLLRNAQTGSLGMILILYTIGFYLLKRSAIMGICWMAFTTFKLNDYHLQVLPSNTVYDEQNTILFGFLVMTALVWFDYDRSVVIAFRVIYGMYVLYNSRIGWRTNLPIPYENYVYKEHNE